MTRQQAALKARGQMIEQVKATAKASLLKKQREDVAVVGAAAVPVLAEVSVQADMARTQAELRGIMRTWKGSP